MTASPIAKALRQGIGVLQNSLGNPFFLWNGEQVPCIPATVVDDIVPDIGGYRDNVTVRLVIRFSDWLSVDSNLVTVDSTIYMVDSGKRRPLVGHTLMFRGKTYRVSSATTDSSEGFCRVDLISPDK